MIVLLVAAGALAFMLLAHRPNPVMLVAGAPAGSGAGKLYRVQVRVPLSHVQRLRASQGGQKTLMADIEKRVEQVGFEKTLLTMQDPTSRQEPLFTVLARRNTSNIKPDSLLRFVRVEEVEEPALLPKIMVPSADALDSGLSPEEVMTVRQALLEDMNPRHLNGIAYCLEPFFPVSASLLRTKADLLDLRKKPNAKSNKALDDRLVASLRSLWDRALGLSSTAMTGQEKTELLRAKAGIEEFAAREGLPLANAKDEVKRVACFMVEKDADTDVSKFPKEIVYAARLLLVEVLNQPDKLAVVCPQRTSIMFPATSDDGFISPSAIQLALATSKPQSAGVFKAGQAPRLYDSLLGADRKDPDNLRARAQMERANRAIERRRWVDWYRRKTNARAGRIRAS